MWESLATSLLLQRGKKVLVGSCENISVSDHDFRKFSIVPGVDFIMRLLMDHGTGDQCLWATRMLSMNLRVLYAI